MSEAALKSAKAVSNFTSVAVEKPAPLMITCVPGFPRAGAKPVTDGAASATNRLERTTKPAVIAARKCRRRISFSRLQSGFLSLYRIERSQETKNKSGSQIKRDAQERCQRYLQLTSRIPARAVAAASTTRT